MAKRTEHREERTERHEHHIHQEKGPWEWALEIGIGLMVLGTLIATSVAAYWTSQQWITLDDQEKRQLRAYIGVTFGDLENVGDRAKQRFSLTRKNYGSTPAYDVIIVAFGESIIPKNGQIPIPAIPPPPDVKGTFTLFPTAEVPFHLTGILPTIDQSWLDRFTKGEDLVFGYVGTIQYHDAFGITRFTYYCVTYNLNGTTAKDADICLTHNDST